PALHTLVVMDAAAAGDGVLSLDEVRERGRGRDAGELESRTHAVGAQDIATMVYTSGTTGPPKGCILTHANVRAAAAGIEEHKFVDGADDLVYLFLPLAHVFARIIQFVAFEEGTPTAYWGGDRDRIIVEVATLKPTLVPSIPRLFEKFYTLIAAHNPKDVVQRATDVGVRVRQLERAGEPVPDDLREEFETFEASLFANVRAAFGGRLNYAVCGGAPLGTDILRFFWACGTPILEDYGLTETMAVISLSTMRDVKLGAVGKPITGMQVRIAPDGELLARGPNVFQGYHGDAQATAAVLVDGWLQTGDLARVDDDGFLEITGRKKDIIITAGGKNITPTNLENDLRQSRWISQAVMYGDRRPYPVALVTLDEEQILPWAREQGLPDEIGTLSRDARVRELVQADLELANGRYGTVEQVKRFAILDRDLTQETGELTPTLKVKRAVVYDKYADLFTELYGEGT
nr:AMP-binding protein [Solirubrobacterales bacterium]